MKKIIIILLITAPLFFLCADSYAQDSREQTISSMVAKLQQKVLLTEDQKNQIINIIRSDNSEGFSGARGRVEELLDKRQRAKYDIIKEDWWKALNRDLMSD